jgi:hypothetical protein
MYNCDCRWWGCACPGCSTLRATTTAQRVRHILHVLSIPSIWPTCSGTYEAHVAEMMERTRTPFVSDFSHIDLRFIYTYCHGDTLFHLRGAVWSFRFIFLFSLVWPTLRGHRPDETTATVPNKHRCRFAPQYNPVRLHVAPTPIPLFK